MNVFANGGFDEEGAPIAWLNVETETALFVFQVREGEAGLFSTIPPDKRSVSIGRCAGASAFWSSDGESVSLLIGDGEEAWSICQKLPMEVLARIPEVLNPLQEWLGGAQR